MSSEEVLTHFKHDGMVEDEFLYRFLSNLFILFDNHLPPAIEIYVRELLTLLGESELTYQSHHLEAA